MSPEVETAVKDKRDVQSLTPEATTELLQLLVDNIKEYAILTLDLRGNVMTWTPTAKRLKGYEASEIVGKHFSLFYTKEDVANGKCERELEIWAWDCPERNA